MHFSHRMLYFYQFINIVDFTGEHIHNPLFKCAFELALNLFITQKLLSMRIGENNTIKLNA